jgi:hypothetical protein
MIKIFLPIILFILVVYFISTSWNKANLKNKKKMSVFIGALLIIISILTIYLVID